jgi:oligoribonuclease NrnB/cAMP/cGMP phosphodiesterase (DHH superfamily)
MEGNVNMKTLFERSNRYERLNKVIAKVNDLELKSSLVKTRDEYWNRIQQLNKPNFTDEDYEQIKQEHQRIDDLISKME